MNLFHDGVIFKVKDKIFAKVQIFCLSLFKKNVQGKRIMG